MSTWQLRRRKFEGWFRNSWRLNKFTASRRTNWLKKWRLTTVDSVATWSRHWWWTKQRPYPLCLDIGLRMFQHRPTPLPNWLTVSQGLLILATLLSRLPWFHLCRLYRSLTARNLCIPSRIQTIRTATFASYTPERLNWSRFAYLNWMNSLSSAKKNSPSRFPESNCVYPQNNF